MRKGWGSSSNTQPQTPREMGLHTMLLWRVRNRGPPHYLSQFITATFYNLSHSMKNRNNHAIVTISIHIYTIHKTRNLRDVVSDLATRRHNLTCFFNFKVCPITHLARYAYRPIGPISRFSRETKGCHVKSGKTKHSKFSIVNLILLRILPNK